MELKNEKEKIYPSLTVNLEYIKSKFNTLINSDITIREFVLTARGKQYSAFILYIDGMINSKSLNDFVLEPLMFQNAKSALDDDNSRVISEAITNNITVRKVKKFNLEEYLMGHLIPQNSIKLISTFEEVITGVNSGNCALFVDTLQVVFDIELKGFPQRSVEKPQNEIVIKGAHEAFAENLRTNTALLRRIVNNENLTVENISIGKVTRTRCALCYINGITKPELVAEARNRMNSLDINSLLSDGQLDQLISDSNAFGIPQILSTERPDKTAQFLLSGRIAIIVNGTPYALIAPAILTDFLTAPDDQNLKPEFANFLRALRIVACFITLLLPGLYMAVTAFHAEILPTELLFSILATRANVPFPIFFEILLMEISFELIRESGLRVPSPIGPTIGIIGSLIVGQAAVTANIVSAFLIIIIAMTGISSFVIPDYVLSFHLRLFRFLFIILGLTAGFLGISLGLFVYFSELCSIQSFGVPYLQNILNKTKKHTFFLPKIWERIGDGGGSNAH